MKQILQISLLFLFFGLIKTQAQVVEWQHIFDKHSEGAGAGKNPNSLVNQNGTISTVVVENDTLKLIQTNLEGEILNTINTEKRSNDNYSYLISVGGSQQVIVFKSSSNLGDLWLLQTD